MLASFTKAPPHRSSHNTSSWAPTVSAIAVAVQASHAASGGIGPGLLVTLQGEQVRELAGAAVIIEETHGCFGGRAGISVSVQDEHFFVAVPIHVTRTDANRLSTCVLFGSTRAVKVSYCLGNES